MSRILGVTGASGYIGQALVRAAAASGWQVVALGRQPVQGVREWRLADLGAPAPADLTRNLDALVHLAADTSGSARLAASEEHFAIDLARQTAARGIPMVFVSSQAAATDAPSAYGRSKFAIEQAILPLGAVAVRPGLVVGGPGAGLYGLLTSLVRALPVLPRLVPSPLVQPIHVDDLAQVLLQASARPDLAGRSMSAAGAPVPFDQLLRAMARHRLRARRWFVPVPTGLLRTALAASSRVLGSRFSPERLDSLTRLPPLDARADLAELGIELRPLDDALQRSGRGLRRLLAEGWTMIWAATGTKPSPWLCRRYAQMLRAQGRHDAMPLPPGLTSSPMMLAALDLLHKRRRQCAALTELCWRLNAATRLAEADPALAHGFLMVPGRSGRLVAVTGIARSVVRELQVRLAAPLARYRARGLR